MTQLVRGIAWRKAQAITLFVLGAVVVAGCLVAAQFSSLTDTPQGSVGVLILLGVVALSVQAAGAARSRRSEIALAQIRGRHGVRLFGYFLAEPVTILLVATVAGVLLGRVVTQAAADRWLDTTGVDVARIDSLGWTTVALALGASLAAVVAGSWRTVREPLVEQLDASHRPRQAGTVVLFGQTLVIVAAAVAAFQASQHAGSRDGWAGIVNPALLSPILLGLAAGQVAAWGLRAVATLSTRRSREARRIGVFLAVRRLARRSDTVFGARLVIAAAVVTAVTASATAAVASWQDESTRLLVGGPRQFPVDEGGLAAYEASHSADADGRWLMAMVAVPDGSERYRRMFADTARWDRVVGDFFADTDAAGVSGQVQDLQFGKQVALLSGSTATVTLTNASLRATFGGSVTITYVTRDGSVEYVILKPKRPKTGQGRSTVTKKIPGCQDGCEIKQLDVDGYQFPVAIRNGHPVALGGSPYLVVNSIDFGGTSLLEKPGSWKIPVEDRIYRHSGQLGHTLRIRLDRRGGTTSLFPAAATQRLYALATPGLGLDSNLHGVISYAVDGSEHPADTVGEVEGLPFVGRRGVLIDLPRALAGAGTSSADAQAVVVARSDTPHSVLDALAATGVTGRARTFDATLAAAQRRPAVQGVRLYILMSVFAAVIAVVGLASAVSGQRDERRREAASLRVTGVRTRHIRSAHRREAWWLAASAGVAVAVTGWVAARVTLGGLGLVPETTYSPLLQGSPHLTTIVVVAVGSGVLVGLITLGVNRRVARSSPPSLLRDDVG